MVFERNEKERVDKIMQHKLKILPQYFKEVVNGNKTFEIRINGRGFKVGDTLILQEYSLLKLDTAVIEYNLGTYTGQEITKEVTYILEGGQYGLEEGYCILGLKQEGIILQNINLTGISIEEQQEKVIEEDNELIEAIVNRDRNNAIEEFWDVVQVRLGVLDMALGIKADEVMEYYPKHLEKLKSRPRKKIKDDNKYEESEE